MTIAERPPLAKVAIFTIVSNNYLHFARTLLKSVAEHHPDAERFCVIVDRDMAPSASLSNEFSVIELEELGIPDLTPFLFKYTVLELNTAVKPWAKETLLKRGYDAVIYIDPDISLYRPMHEVMSALSGAADIVVTPHLLSPVMDDKKPSELDIRRAGTYNFGFCAVRNTDNTLNLLHWWQGKLFNDCIVDMNRGIFVDQSWMDLVPGLFDNVTILRHPGYNVAYWNIAQRPMSKAAAGKWMVDGHPLVFFHYSGFNPLKPEPFSKHQDRFTLSTLGPEVELVKEYAQTVLSNDDDKFSGLAYGFASFEDGTKIPDGFRRLYLQTEQLRKKIGDNPFAHPEALAWPVEGIEVADGLPISWTMLSVMKDRIDLQRAFDLGDVAGVKGFWQWFIAEGDKYVSPEVLEQHKDSWADIIGEFDGKWATRCGQIYGRMLGRSPNKSEMRKMRKLCKTRFGSVLAVFSIAVGSESRARGNNLRRIEQSLRSFLKKKKISKPTELAAFAPVASKRVVSKSYDGFQPQDADSAVQGFWCGGSVSVPLGIGPHGLIEISGTIDMSMHGRASVSKVNLNLFLDGETWRSETLNKDGSFAISGTVPQRLVNSRSLQIVSDSVFVPKEIGLGDDSRRLSYRLAKVSVDQLEIVDSGRAAPFMPREDLFKTGGFNLIGYVYAELGVGEAARSMALAATEVALPYSVVDVGYQSSNRQTDFRVREKAVRERFDIDMLYVNADQTPTTLEYLASKGHPAAGYRIGYWHWEQPRLSEQFLGSFDGLDEVWVPTSFVHEAVSAISPIPVYKVPHALQFSVDGKWTRGSFGLPEDKFTVLVMYDFHSYRFRKNPEAAIDAFKRVAKGRKDMCLVIKTINAGNYVDDYTALKREVRDLDSVVFIDEVYARDQLYGLEANCDCLLSLHRAEGFGLGPAEMMYLGKPVIATGWSGNMEFMTPMNSCPVNYDLRPLEKPLGVYVAGLDWAEPDVEHAADYLKRLVEDPSLAHDIGQRAQHDIRRQLNPKVIGELYRERFSLIGMRR